MSPVVPTKPAARPVTHGESVSRPLATTHPSVLPIGQRRLRDDPVLALIHAEHDRNRRRPRRVTDWDVFKEI
jgi:hypothetical protein